MAAEVPEKTLLERAARGLVGPYFALAHRIRWQGVGNVPRTGPAILAANHQSYFDPVAIGLAADRRVIYMGEQYYYRMPVVGALMGLFHTVSVDLDSPAPSSVSLMLRALDRGCLCGIFPEGARSPDELIGRPRSGVAMLALRSGAPLIPVTVSGAYGAWPSSRLLPRPAPISMHFGEPMKAEGKSTRRRRREITIELMLRIADGFNQLGRPDLASRSRRRLLEMSAA